MVSVKTVSFPLFLSTRKSQHIETADQNLVAFLMPIYWLFRKCICPFTATTVCTHIHSIVSAALIFPLSFLCNLSCRCIHRNKWAIACGHKFNLTTGPQNFVLSSCACSAFSMSSFHPSLCVSCSSCFH